MKVLFPAVLAALVSLPALAAGNLYVNVGPVGAAILDGSSPAVPQPVMVNTDGGIEVHLLNNLPKVSYAAPSNVATSSTANTGSVLFAIGSIAHGCFVQNVPSNTATVVVDFGGGSPSAPIAAETLSPGDQVSCAGIPSTAVTFWSSAAGVAITGGSF